MSPTSATTRRPVKAIADRGRHDAVDAVGAAVRVVRDSVAPSAIPLDVAHRHRRGRHDRGIVERTLGHDVRDQRFAQRRVRPRARRSITRCAISSARVHDSQPLLVDGGHRGRHRRRPGSTPSRVRAASARRSGSIHTAVTIDDHVLRCRGQPLIDDLRRPRIADAHHDFGLMGRGPFVDAQQGIRVRDGRRTLETGAASRIGQHRPSERRREPVDRGRVVDAVAGDEYTAPTR